MNGLNWRGNWKRAAVLCLIGAAAAAAGNQVRVTEAYAADGSGAHYAFIDADDPAVRQELIAAMSTEFKGQVYAQGGKGAVAGPVVVMESRGGIMHHASAGADFGVGAALCVGACLFVQVAGDDVGNGPPPDGFNVMAGDKVVNGAPAVLPCVMGTTGLFFIGKSIIEAFMSPEGYSQAPVKLRTTDEILAQSNLKKSQVKIFDADKMAREELQKDVLLYCVATI